MKKKLFLLALLVSLFFSACQKTNPPLSDEQKTTIEKQVLEQMEKMSAMVEKSDAAAYCTFLSENGFLAMHSGGTAFLDRQAYADTVGVWFGQRKRNEFLEKKVKVTVLSTDLALLDQQSHFRATFRNDTVVNLKHVVSFLFKKEESGWKVIHGHESWKGN